MKVFLSKPHDHWISPYTMLDYAFFWTDWSKCSRDKSLAATLDRKYVDHPEWVEKFSDLLVPISQAIQWVWDRVQPEVKYIKIDYWDTWSMDTTLTPIILPMLKQLKAVKHGSGMVDMNDVPEHLRATNTEDYEDQLTFDFYKESADEKYDIGPNVHTRWDWVMGEMIWAFEQLNDDDWEQQYYSGVADYQFVKEKDSKWGEVSRMIQGPKHTQTVDMDGMKKHADRIQNGLRLFGVYFRNLWD